MEVSDTVTKMEVTETLTVSDVHPLLIRKHIVKGYRLMNQPLSYYYKSAFCSHNEVMNVWTHFVPAIILGAFYLVPELNSEQPRFPVIILHLGILALLLGSSLAHLLHSRSHLDHIFWFLIDFSGIALFGVSIGLQRYACNEDMSLFQRLVYLPSLMVVVLGMQFLSTCYLFVCKPHWPRRLELRMFTCLLLAFWLYVPLVYRYLNASEDDESLSVHTRSFLWLLYSGVFMGAHVPERFAPGIFDIFGYGHQLFHLCINMVAWNLLSAADMDCSVRTAPWNTSTNIAIAGVFSVSALFIVTVVHHLVGKAQHLKYD